MRYETLLQEQFAEGDISEARELLSEYVGREPDRVRWAIAKLAYGSISGLKHFLGVAKKDYRDILYWAEYSQHAEEAATKQELLGGMTVNERLWHLGLHDQYDAAIDRRNEAEISAILRKCMLSQDNIDAIIKSKFDT